MSRWQASLISLAGLTVAACSTVKYTSDYDPQAEFSNYKTYEWVLPNQDEQAALDRINPFLGQRLQDAVDRELSARGYEESTETPPDFWVSVYPIVPDRRSRADRRAAAAYGRGYGRSRVSVSVGFGFGVGFPYRYGWGSPYRFAWGHPYFGYRYPSGFPYAFGFPYFSFWFPVVGYPAYAWHPGFGVGLYPAPGYVYRAAPPGGLQLGTIIVDVSDARSGELVWRGWAEGALWDLPDPKRLTDYVDDVIAKTMKPFPPPDRR